MNESITKIKYFTLTLLVNLKKKYNKLTSICY